MKRNLVGKILGKIKIFVQDFVPIRTALRTKNFNNYLEILKKEPDVAGHMHPTSTDFSLNNILVPNRKDRKAGVFKEKSVMFVCVRVVCVCAYT